MNTYADSRPRIASVDVFRALTMMLMIFVNDFWSIKGVPHWMKHAAGSEDMLGLSDVVFPAFLFIMGMSIPLDLDRRIAKGASIPSLLWRILTRSFALVVMGVFFVNMEGGVSQTIGIPPSLFKLAVLVSFFLIWNLYPRTENKVLPKVFLGLKILGAVALIVLAILFRDASGEHFQKHWWGILGLIGWTYGVCAVVYLWLRKYPIGLLSAAVVFVILCMAGASHQLGAFANILPGNGCFHSFAMFGLLLSLFFNKVPADGRWQRKLLYAAFVGLGFFVLGFIAHKWWIISKLGETPTWLFFCTGISIWAYMLIYWLTDVLNLSKWFVLIRPAGTATLTCYLMPSFLYLIFTWTGFRVTGIMAEGILGLVKCFLFSMLAIGVTALIGKIGIKLKV